MKCLVIFVRLTIYSSCTVDSVENMALIALQSFCRSSRLISIRDLEPGDLHSDSEIFLTCARGSPLWMSRFKTKEVLVADGNTAKGLCGPAPIGSLGYKKTWP